MSDSTPDDLQALVEEIRGMKKYRELNLLESTVRDILLREMSHHKKPKEAVKAARKKLHRVIAPYLGDPDYAEASERLTSAFETRDPALIQAACAAILNTHDSTRERLTIAAEFYPRIFAVTGVPAVLLDVACGLNPLFFEWMGVDKLTLYAYDIHQQRADFLNHYFALQPRLDGHAIRQDILVTPPAESGDVALILKEIHRFEDRQHGVTRRLLEALNVAHIVVSLPPRNLTGQHDLREAHRNLFYRTLGDNRWPVTEITFENELVFCIHKSG